MTTLSDNPLITIASAALGAMSGSIITPYFSDWLRRKNETSTNRQKVGRYLLKNWSSEELKQEYPDVLNRYLNLLVVLYYALSL